MDGRVCHFNSRTADQSGQCLRNGEARMTVEGLQNEDALGNEGGQQHQLEVALVARLERSRGNLGISVIVLDQVADDEIRINDSAATHLGRPRWFVFAAAARRICPKESPRPLSLASTPFSDFVPA